MNERLGMAITNLGVVGEVVPGLQAEVAGIRVGAQILAIDGALYLGFVIASELSSMKRLSGARVRSLDEVKLALAERRASGQSSSLLSFQNPTDSKADVQRTHMVCIYTRIRNKIE